MQQHGHRPLTKPIAHTKGMADMAIDISHAVTETGIAEPDNCELKLTTLARVEHNRAVDRLVAAVQGQSVTYIDTLADCVEALNTRRMASRMKLRFGGDA